MNALGKSLYMLCFVCTIARASVPMSLLPTNIKRQHYHLSLLPSNTKRQHHHCYLLGNDNKMYSKLLYYEVYEGKPNSIVLRTDGREWAIPSSQWDERMRGSIVNPQMLKKFLKTEKNYLQVILECDKENNKNYLCSIVSCKKVEDPIASML